MAILQETSHGLYCPAGDFYVDPWRPVPRAVVTHGHTDHARWGCDAYLTTTNGIPVLQARLGPDATIEGLDYGETRRIGDATVSLHPAGHLLGSAQVRIACRGEVWVVTGDYKRESDPTCVPFEPVPCHGLVSECTFGLPVYKWQPTTVITGQINAWWRDNAARGDNSVVFAYALGKAQRVLARLDPDIGPILLHGAVDKMTTVYRRSGVLLPAAAYATAEARREARGAMIIAPPSADGSPWLRRCKPVRTAFASGWMAIRGRRRRRVVDRGFILSDHVDWDGLWRTVRETGCETLWATHGYLEPVVRYAREELGLDARAVKTRFTGELDDDPGKEPS